MNMVKTKYISTEDMIYNVQELKGKTKLKFYKNIGIYFDKMNLRMDEDPFAKNGQGNSKIYHEVFLLMKFLQTQPQIKNMNFIYYELYYTVTRNRTEKDNEEEQKEIVDNQNDNDYINFNDVVPKHYIGIKNRNEILR